MISPSLKRAARRSTHSQFFHTAQIKFGGAVLATEHNKGEYRTDGEGHAEVRACLRASAKGRSLRGATIISIRVTATGKLANARPCMKCVATLREYGIKKVVYSTAEGTSGTERL